MLEKVEKYPFDKNERDKLDMYIHSNAFQEYSFAFPT